MYFAGGSGRVSFPRPNLTLISQELAADKNKPSRSLDKSSRARRLSLLGAPSAQRKTPVSSRYFIASHSLVSSVRQESRQGRVPAMARQSLLRSSSDRSQSPAPYALQAVLLGPSAPQERHGWQWLFLLLRQPAEAASTVVF